MVDRSKPRAYRPTMRRRRVGALFESRSNDDHPFCTISALTDLNMIHRVPDVGATIVQLNQPQLGE